MINLLPHNQQTFEKIKESLKDTNNICLIQGTGTGKSFLFMALVDELFKDKRVLFVVPKISVADNMRNYKNFAAVADRIDFKTYNFFTDEDKNEQVLNLYDLIAVDEVHHLGSEIYGQNLQNLLEKVKQAKGKYYIGMTATPIRSADKVDVRSYFAKTVNGPDVMDCIEAGLMPPIEYLVCQKSLIDELKERNVKEVIDYDSSEDLLKAIVRDNPKDRWICFFSNIKALKKQRPLVEKLFPGYDIYEVHKDSYDTIESIGNAPKDSKYVILSVDMLLEGIHIPNMEGIILFRNIISLTVFSQVLGRVCSIGVKESPLVIDCTDIAYRLLEKLQRAKRPHHYRFVNTAENQPLPLVKVSLSNTKYFNLNSLLQKIKKEEYELKTVAADETLLKEWDYEKNVGLDPKKITVGSGLKVHWKCSKGHEWEADVVSRYHGTGCPVCVGKKVCKGENDLETLFPELAKEWHPTKNGDLKPCDVVPGSNRKAWWLCKEGHEWKASILHRKNGTGCPVCTNKVVLQGYNDLETLYPELAKEWHPTKNGDLKPCNVTSGSNKIVWWLCEKGHEWEAVISGRCGGSGCPYCTSHRVCSGYNDLETLYPELAKEWHPIKNGSLKPCDVMPGSHRKVWWLCEKGHEWEAVISNRCNGNKCPACANQKVIKGKNDLETLYPELAKEWHPTKNGDLKPCDVVPGSNRKAWWLCKEGHEWETSICKRTKGSGCRYCAGKDVWPGYNDLETLYPEVAAEWHPTKNGDLKPSQVRPFSHQKVWWLCEYGHEWEAPIAKRSAGQGCQDCNKESKRMRPRNRSVYE